MENSAPRAPNPAATNVAPGSAGRPINAILASQLKGARQTPTTAHKIDQESARLAILAAWPGWAAQSLSGRAAKDNDAHAFLRALRGEHPEFFTFRCSLSPHEIAFSWLLKGRCIAY